MRKTLLFLVPLAALLACCGPEKSPDDPEIVFDKNLDHLQESGLLPAEPDAQTQLLIDSCRADSVNGIPSLLQATGKMLVLDLATRRPSRSFGEYKKMHDAVTRFFKELACDSSGMTFTLLDNEEDFSDTISCAMDIYKKDKHFFRDLGDGVLPYSKHYEDTAYLRLDPDFWKVYNQLLASDMAETRLFAIPYRYIIDRDEKNKPVYREDPEKLGLVMLGRKQYEALARTGLLGICENEFNIFSPEQTVSLFGKLLNSGLIGNPDSAGRDLLLETLLGNSLYAKTDLYEFCDTSFCSLNFDTLNDVEPYTMMLQSLAGISQMQFDPMNISEKTSENEHAVVVSYYAGGSNHTFTYRRGPQRLDTRLLDDVNNLLRRSNANGQFYAVGHNGHALTVVFIRPGQLDRARKAGIFDYIEPGVPAALRESDRNNVSVKQ